MDSRSLFSAKAKHTFLDLITSSISEEGKQKIIKSFHEKESLLDGDLLEIYLSGQPLLLTISLILIFISVFVFILASVVSSCRFFGRCGGRRYQPHPTSSRRFIFLIVAFLFSWLLLSFSSLNFVLSGAAYWGQRNPTQLTSFPVKESPIDYPEYENRRTKREESILTSLFNDPDYNGDFEGIDEEVTTTTEEPSFVQETRPPPRDNLPIGGTVFMTRNGEIKEEGTTRRSELTGVEEGGDEEEEYIEGEDEEEEEEEETTTMRREEEKKDAPKWTYGIGKGDEWEEVLKRGNEETKTTIPSSTRRTTTTSTTTTSTTTTTRRTTTTTTTPPTTTTRRTTSTTTTPSTTSQTTTIPSTYIPSSTHLPLPPLINSFPSFNHSIIDPITVPEDHHSSFNSPSSFFPNDIPPLIKGIPSPSSFTLPPLSSDIFIPQGSPPIPSQGEDVIPIQIGHFNTKKTQNNGRPAISLLSDRRKFESLDSSAFRSLHRIFAVVLGLLLSLCTLPSLLLVIIGSMYYFRSYHPMDRSKVSDRVGILCVIMSLLLLFSIPILLIHSTLGLLFSHTHHALCPLLQPPSTTVDDILLALDGCSHVLTPLITMWESSMLAAFSSFPVSILLLQLSAYFLRMKTEHYWTHADSGQFILS